MSQGLRRLVALVVLLVPARSTPAGDTNIRGNLHEAPRLVGLDPRLGPAPDNYRNAVDALVDSAARALPIPSASAALTYRFDPSTGTYQRTSVTFGPTPFVERPQTLGRGVWNLGVTAQYLQLDEFDGHTVGRDTDPRPIGIYGCSGCPFPIGHLSVTPKIIYHLATVNLTYGVGDDLDLNVAVPLAAVDFDANVSLRDGRALLATQHGHVPIGVADMLVRAKYRLGDCAGVATAAGFVARLPSGNRERALGTGEAELGPYLAASTLVGSRVEPHLNAGFDFDVENLDRSSGHYALGLAVQAVEDRLDLGLAFLGRSEVGERVPAAEVAVFRLPPRLVGRGPIPQSPFLGLHFDRKDYLDLSVGGRVRLYETLVLTLSALKALNDDGLRSSNWSPVIALEATF